MIVAVIGPRDYLNKQHVYSILHKLFEKYPDATLISGGATGVDSLAEEYCKDYGHDIIVCGAGWKVHGKAGGPIRNKRIIECADYIITFWDNISRGTGGAIDIAIEIGKKDRLFVYDLLPLQ